ncbi:MAG: RagB/SusD family nutrient uptake outer membrane protein [Chitinophagaceae bacterium]|nr:MAG: RagB/SusD family nutrient uptake outer membrane protein [Chitinophagaceae bacterium]
MKKILYNITCGALLLASMTGCKKQLELDPKQSVDVSVALTSREGINAAITGVYASLKSTTNYGRDLLAVSEALADNAFATQKSGRLLAENQNGTGAHFVLWQNNYYAIAQINQVLAAIPSLNVSPAVTTAERNSWEGQLYFLRALMYHDLARVYGYEPGMGVQGQDRGSVPVMLATPGTIPQAQATTPARATADSVYRRIYADLDSANRRLTTSNAGLPFVATKVAAQALFARVALYRRDWVNAARWCDSVLNVPANVARLATTSSYVSSWTSQTNPESLFEIRFANQSENIGVNTSLQTSYTTLGERGKPSLTVGFGDLVPATPLLQALGFTGIAANGSGGTFTGRSDDVRNLLFESGTTGRGTARIECTKFIGKNGVANLDNVPVIRIPEVYLIRSEARLNNGDVTGALADLQKVKQARYTNYATTQQGFDNGLSANTGLPIVAPTAPAATTLYGEILKQRRLEYAFEGHRWFDFKRLGLTMPKSTATLYTGYTDFKVLAPIPTRETDVNPNMVQNFGY